MTFISAESSLAQLRRALHESWRGLDAQGVRWVGVECPAPVTSATSLVDLKASPHSVYWTAGDQNGEHPSEERFGIGAAKLIQLTGSERLTQAQTEVADCYSQIVCSNELRPELRFFGGASFSPQRANVDPSWKQFGDAYFLLPRVLYCSTASGARLICLSEHHDIEETLRLAEQVLNAAEEVRAPDSRVLNATVRQDSAPPLAWHALVEAIQSSIRSGNLEKVVAARCVRFDVAQNPCLSTVMARLSGLAPRCARFALTVFEQTFVGATPERLVLKVGKSVKTEALAGSIDARVEGAEDILLSSQKDRQEHACVVRAIEETLSPLCQDLSLPSSPDVRALKDILHLRTSISGTLNGDVHVLSLVDSLHPTPAVEGLPRGKAVSWILKHETAQRGWYAAPIGWLNHLGDGEFVVALRSALISDKNIRVYAGAGIVAGSDPEAEYAETELKLSGMLSALGLAS
jgi:isochorismate synthase